MSDIGLKGGPELLAMLDQLPQNLASKVLRGGIRAAGAVVRDEARQMAPRQSGLMAKSIKLGSARYDRKDALVSIRVKVGGEKGNKGNSHAFLAWIWEYGSAAYSGQKWQRDGSTRTRSVKLKFDGETTFGRFPDVAAHRAHPFMRPALDRKAAEAINAMGSYIAQRLSWNTLTAPEMAVTEGDD